MTFRLLFKLLSLPVTVKKAGLLAIDFTIIVVSIYSAYCLHSTHLFIPDIQLILLWSVHAIALVGLLFSFGIYQSIIRFANLDLIRPVAKSIAIYTALAIIASYVLANTPIKTIPAPIVIIFVCFSFLGIIAFRYLLYHLLRDTHIDKGNKGVNSRVKNVLIYGAGRAGFQLAMSLRNHVLIKVIGFVDDDSSISNKIISGISVYPPNDIQQLLKTHAVSEVLLALPSAKTKERSRIINNLEPLPVLVRTLPDLASIVAGRVQFEDVREVDVTDLVGRNIVPPAQELLTKNIQNNTVLVTGAGGSIGAELCRQIVNLSPKLLILYEQSEFNLYTIDMELSNTDTPLIKVLGSIDDHTLFSRICNDYQVDTIFHAAAYKHVPLVEENPFAGIHNNIFGTYAISEIALSAGVKTFVLISTDKAVNPTNIMGASKRFSEMILQALNHKDQDKQSTRFVMVRFGNVLGSSGSAIPLFRKQIKQGGPITVTHKEITRYFMTIPEAAQLVIQAGAMGKGGDVFVLDMGKPIKILDLVKRMVRLSGLQIKDDQNPEGDIEVIITGLRPGEKLYEELLIGNNTSKTNHKRILRAEEEYVEWPEIEKIMAKFELFHKTYDREKLSVLLHEVIEGFQDKRNQ